MKGALDRLGARASAQGKTVGQEVMIPLEKLRFDPTQPRQVFHAMDGIVDPEAQVKLEELAESIKQSGLIQAITVQELGDGTYLVVVGERRARAHLLNKESTIRATIRNDLTNRSRRLIYQLAENVDRAELTDEELARTVKELLETGNDGKPMTPGELAHRLAKSPGWLTRYIKYGDEELQRLWVRTGICDSVEKVYRISLLPVPVQLEILRRVDLPEDHPEHLKKPLNRNIIDGLGKEAKTKARVEVVGPGQAFTAPPANTGTGTGKADPAGQGDGAEKSPGAANGDGWQVGAGTGPQDGAEDEISAALREAMAPGGALENPGPAAGAEGQPPAAGGSYSLPDDVRSELLKTTHDDLTGQNARPADLTVPPCPVRMSLQSMGKLLELLSEESGSMDAARGVRCDLLIPGLLAARLANTLAGVTVDPQEVPTVLQRELGQLS